MLASINRLGLVVFLFGLCPQLNAVECPSDAIFQDVDTVFDEMSKTLARELGQDAKLDVIIHYRINADGEMLGSLWADLKIKSKRDAEIGSIKLSKMHFDESLNSLDDLALVKKLLDVSKEHAYYPEMIRLILEQQPTPGNAGSVLPQLKASFKKKFGGPAPTWENDPILMKPSTPLTLRLMRLGERIALGLFCFENNELKISRLDVKAKRSEKDRFEFRNAGLGTALVEMALRIFPSTERIYIPELIEDNQQSFLEALKSGSGFRTAFLDIPSYKSAARLGFEKIHSVVIHNSGTPGSQQSHYGFITIKGSNKN